jgi:hypothetical protein
VNPWRPYPYPDRSPSCAVLRCSERHSNAIYTALLLVRLVLAKKKLECYVGFQQLLPITAVVAVCLFALKELIEAFRRYFAERRRIRAIKSLIAVECELNLWAVKSLTHVLETIRDDLAAEGKPEFKLFFPRDGRVRFKSTQGDGSYIGFAIAPVHTEHLTKNTLEIATFGGSFDRAAREALEALSDLEHLRQSVIYFVEPDDKDDLVHRESFLDYAFSELPEIKRLLGLLYKECTGNELVEHRVR